MTKAILTIVLAIGMTAFAEEKLGDKISNDLDKAGDKIEAAFDGKKKTTPTEEKISNDLDKAGDKIEGKTERGANKAKKTVRKAKDEICETVNGKLKCVKQKVKHSVKNTEDEVKTEVKH